MLAVAIVLLVVAGAVGAWRVRRNATTGAGGGGGAGGAVRVPVAPATSGTVGIAEGSSLVFRSDDRVDADLAGMRAAGARWVRFDLWWGAVEPDRGEARWRDVEYVVRSAARHGLDVIVIPLHPPAWARPAAAEDAASPADPAEYAAFVGRATQRLAPLGVHVWEIWNEPNTPTGWEKAPDPHAYARLLQAAVAAVRAEDRGATVLFGGLAPGGEDRMDPAAFVRAVYEAGGRGSFDAMAVHPYGVNELDTTDAERVRAVMERFGDAALKVWGTEFGVPTSGAFGAPVSDETQARALAAGVATWRRLPWAGPLLVYMYRDLGGRRSNAEGWFGIVRPDGTRKPAFATLRAAIAAAEAGGAGG